MDGRSTPTNHTEALLRQLAEQRRHRGAPPATLRVGDLLSATDPLAARPDCPHPRRVEDYVAGRLRRRQVPALRDHLQRCPGCRAYAVSLREACARPLPPTPAPVMATPTPRTAFGTPQIVGLSIAGVLFLMANTAVLDVLSALEGPATTVAAASVRPADERTEDSPSAERTVVAPAAVVAEPQSPEGVAAAAPKTPVRPAATPTERASRVSQRP